MSLASPYKGLAPFGDSEVDSLLFFGRERDTEVVAANLIASRLTVLYGPSGVGKSSLLLASVGRSLRELPEQPLVIVYSNWTDDPESGLAAAVAEQAGLQLGTLLDVVTQVQRSRDVYVILDQAEEYFTYHGDANGFESVLADLVNGPLRVNVLVALREDALARLDRLKAAIPTLFGNVLRLDRLDRVAGAAAILKPLERWNHLEASAVVAEAGLVEAVLDGVGTGQVQVPPGAASRSNGNGAPRGIEAPYLQLVMQRVWEVERERGSETLRLSTLESLGGARRIVADHLERAMSSLDARAQDLAAAVFGVLVTASGTKIAHEGNDLAEYAEVPAAMLLPVLDSLAERRILRRDEHGRYEIFHDVLAVEVLDWRRRHLTERALERERQAARRRQRRLGLLAGLALAGIALTAGLAVWALSERREANEQAAAARQAESSAEEQTALARGAERRFRQEALRARRAERNATLKARAARRAERRTAVALGQARASAQREAAAKQSALDQAAIARSERDRADQQAETAHAATQRANVQTAVARQALGAARTSAQQERRARLRADRATLAAQARERLAAAQALLTTNPEGALQAALDSLEIDGQSPVEPVLREGLLRSRVLDIFPVGGGEVVGAFTNGDATSAQSLRSSSAASGSDSIVTVARGGVVRIFERHDGSLLRTIKSGMDVTSAALSPDGRTVALGDGRGVVRLLAVSTGEQLRSIDHVGAVLSITFSPDGRSVVTTGTNETAKVWNAATGALVHRLAHPRAVRSASFSPDGTRLATLSSDRFVRVFDLATGRLSVRLDQVEAPTSAVFLPTGQTIVTTGQDETPRVWEVASGSLITSLAGHDGNVLAAAVSPAGDRIATASTDGTARVWDAQTGRLVLQLVGHTSFVDAVAFGPDGRRVLTASRDGTARLWNAVTGAQQAQFLGHTGRVKSVAFGSDGKWALTAGDDGTVRTWSLGAEPELRTIAEGSSPVRDIAASKNGDLVAEGRADGAVTVRAANGRPLLSVRLDRPVTSVALSDDGGRLLATAEDGSVGVWAVKPGSKIASYPHGAPATAGVFMPGARGIVVAGRDGIVRAWDLGTGKSRVVVREAGPVADVAVSPDGSLVGTAVGDVARIRPLGGGGRAVVFTGHRDEVASVSFSPDGARLLTTSFDHDASIWNVRNGKREKTLVGHVAIVRGAAFSRDGRWVVTAGPSRAGVWEASTSSLVDSRLYFLVGHRGALSAAAFVGPRWRIYTGGVDGTVRRYRCRLCAGTETLRQIAAAKLARLERDMKR